MPCGVCTTSRPNVCRCGAHQPHRAQPLGRDAAGGGLALADLVAVEHQHARAGARSARARRPGRRSSPRRSGRRRRPPAECARRRAWSGGSACGQCSYPCRRSAGDRDAYATQDRRGLGRPPARDRRPDRPQLRRDHRPLRGGRRGVREGSSRSTRTRSWSTSATRARASSRSASCRSASRSTRTTRSSSARRSTRSSSPRRTRTAACCCPRSGPASRRPGARSRPRPSPASRSRAP